MTDDAPYSRPGITLVHADGLNYLQADRSKDMLVRRAGDETEILAIGHDSVTNPQTI